MQLELVQIQVDSEKEIHDGNDVTIQANLSLHCKLIGQNSEAYVILPMTVINTNSQTGVQMDAQRASEAAAYLQGF